MENKENPADKPNTENPESKPKKSYAAIIGGVIIILLLCAVGIGGAAFVGNRLYHRIQGTPLVSVKGPSVTPSAATTAPPTGATPAATPSTAAQASSCGRSDQQIILLLGYDNRVEYPNGSDGVRLLRADYANQTIELLALPRGLWVVAPEEVQPTLKAASLGELYQYGLDQDGADIKEARSYAAHLVAQAVYYNFGLAADNYAVMEMATFVEVVDSLGGIDITLPATMTLNGQTYNAGTQHWDGATALQFVRALPDSDTDWDRFSRQDLVLQAIRASTGVSSMLSQLPDLLTAFEDGVTTDLNVADAASFSCLSKLVPAGQVQVESLPESMVTQGPGVYLMPDYVAIRDYLQNWASGE